MGMNNGPEIGAVFVNALVKGKFGGGGMTALRGSIGKDMNNILTGKVSLVDAGRRDPDGAVLVVDGEIAARGGGHAVAVDALHGGDELISRVRVATRRRCVDWCCHKVNADAGFFISG